MTMKQVKHSICGIDTQNRCTSTRDKKQQDINGLPRISISCSLACARNDHLFDPAYLISYLRQRLHASLQLLLDFRQFRALGKLLIGELQLLLNGGYFLVLQLFEPNNNGINDCNAD